MQVSSISSTNFGLRYGKKTAEIFEKSRQAAEKKGEKELAAWDKAKTKLDNCIKVKGHAEDYLLCHRDEGIFDDKKGYIVVTPFKIDYGNLEGFGYGVLTTRYDELLDKEKINLLIKNITKGPYSVKYDEKYYKKYEGGFEKIPSMWYEL